MRPAIAQAPLRLDLAGGTLDIWPLHLCVPPPAVTVNVAFDLPGRAEVRPRADAAIGLVSLDRDVRELHPDADALARAVREETTALPLLARAVLAWAPAGGLDLVTEAQSPVGAGLGGSSGLVVAVLGALAAAQELSPPHDEIRRVAQDLEAATMKGPTGYQDFHPPLWGGCLALEGRAGGIDVERLPVDLDALARRLRLVYTGEPHVSALTNWGVLRAYFDGEEATRTRVHEVARLAALLRDDLRAGDLDRALERVVEEGRVREGLAPGVSTPEIRAIDEAARAAGALGTKIMGAGGGGCVLVVLPPERGDAVDRALDETLSRVTGTRMPVRLSAVGLRVET